MVLLPQSELWARGLVQTVILGLHHNPDYLLLLGEQMMSAPNPHPQMYCCYDTTLLKIYLKKNVVLIVYYNNIKICMQQLPIDFKIVDSRQSGPYTIETKIGNSLCTLYFNRYMFMLHMYYSPKLVQYIQLQLPSCSHLYVPT